MDQIGWIRRLHRREKKSEREIARITGLSRNTVSKWLHGELVEPKYRRAGRPNKLAPFVEALQQALAADAKRPKHERRTAKALYAQIKAQCYQGGYTRVTDHIRRWRVGAGAAASNAFVPLAFELGEAYQFDWSEEGLVVGGIYYRAQVAHMKLCASRAFWLVAYPSQGHEMLFDAHNRGFAALGGVARRGIYDNMKTAVDRVKKGKGREVNARFSTMCAHERRWGGFAELNAWLGERCRQLWSELRHPEQQRFTVAEMLELEREHLLEVCAPFDGYVHKLARVSSTCLVSVAGNRYSVPCELAGQTVSTRLYPGRVTIVFDQAVVAEHERLADRGKTAYDWQHYVPLLQRKPGALRNGAPFADLPEPLQRLRRVLLREDGGDRLMAKVLALVPTAGLDAVLVAVELALEAAPPSGRVSAEHVFNVLARLNAAPAPQAAATALRAKTPPVADTARYDALRTTQDVQQEADHA